MYRISVLGFQNLDHPNSFLHQWRVSLYINLLRHPTQQLGKKHCVMS